MSYVLGKFGEFVKQYEKARRPYPPEVFTLLKSVSGTQPLTILDLGCGTGISTRQLRKYGTVVGCDPDEKMLQAAKYHPKKGKEQYVKASAERLPFKNESFTTVTAFASFHWFDNKKCVQEIRRVLKPGGLLFVVNKAGVKSWGEGYRKAIMVSIGQEIAKFKEETYNPRQTLIANNFKLVKTRQWKKHETYSLHNAIEYVQSISIWNSVPVTKRLQALTALRTYFARILKRLGRIERRYTVKVVFGHK